MTAEKNLSGNKRIRNAVFFLIVGLLAGIAITFSVKHDAHSNNLYSNNDDVYFAKESDSLQAAFVRLQQLNERYASLLTDKTLGSSQLIFFDSLNILITQNETDLVKRLDSLQISNSNFNEHSSGLFSKIIAIYKLSLDQSNALNTVRDAVNIGNTSYNLDQTTINTMQTQLRLKEAQVIALTGQLYNYKNSVANNVPVDIKTILKQHDSALNNTLQLQQNRNKSLTDNINKLKQDNDKLTNKIISFQKQDKQNNQTNVATAAVSTDDTGDQVSLAKVDCYLSRADANQIVSNEKQRKDLLQSALTILNKLSQSSNTYTKQQAELKIAHLKIIAANNHD